MTKERIAFYRTPVDRTLLKKLTARRNLPGLLQSLGMLGIYAVGIGGIMALWTAELWFPFFFACYLFSFFQGFLGMEASVHELSHKTPFKTRWLNELFYGIFAFFTWNNPVHFRESHRRHHQFTLFAGQDKEVVIPPGPFGPKDYISWFLFDYEKFKMIMRGNWAYLRGRDTPDTFSWDPLFEKDDPRRARMMAWARFQFLGHIALIILFAVLGLWPLIYLVSFSYFFATFLSRSCEIVQHVGLPQNVPDWRVNCHTMKFGPVMAFLYWRMNWHTEHHMYAAVPFWNLHRLHQAIAHDCPEPVVGHWKGVRKILSLIKAQRKDPAFVFEHHFPESASPPKLS
ncbi:MAG: fatty acid desaturase [Spirochaetaceae bacterium]|nr:fatty acid desaturase [Spirochaetaceae bacterium]